MSLTRWLALVNFTLLAVVLIRLWRVEVTPSAPPGFRRTVITISILLGICVVLNLISVAAEWMGAHR